jgi:hypothetical protein
MSMAEARTTVDLATFLAGLPAADRAEVGAAAARIEALEREIGPPGWIERHFLPLVAVALVLFVLGLAALAGLIAGPGGVIGLGTVVLLLAAFPVLILAYLLSVRGRTRLDDAKMALNGRYFLPHGGVYFGAGDSGGGTVLLVDKPEPKEMNLRERTQAQYEAATKRRWWW